MVSFNSQQHDNAISPFSLSSDEIEEIYNAVDDDRLKNPDGDYFVLDLRDKKIKIPKQKKIGIKTDTEKITVMKTADYIKQLLDRQDN